MKPRRPRPAVAADTPLRDALCAECGVPVLAARSSGCDVVCDPAPLTPDNAAWMFATRRGVYRVTLSARSRYARLVVARSGLAGAAAYLAAHDRHGHALAAPVRPGPRKTAAPPPCDFRAGCPNFWAGDDDGRSCAACDPPGF